MKHLKPPDLRSAAAAGSYVYCYLRNKSSKTAKEATPYYVGVASSSDRPLHKNHNAPVPSNQSLIRIMRQGLNWQQALLWERFYISRYGRKDIGTGILVNLTDGGDGAKGAIRSAEQRERYRQASTGRLHSEGTKEKLRQIRQGNPLTEETRQKISWAIKGKSQSDEWVNKRMEAHRGAVRSQETRERIREKALGRKSPSVAAANAKRVWDDDARQRHSKAMKLSAIRRKHNLATTIHDC